MDELSRVLKESWSLVEDRQDRISSYFYARLFLAAPQLRDLFPIQLRAQRRRLMAAIARAIQTIGDPVQFDAEMRSLGRMHRRFDVTNEHHAVFRDCLIEALRVHSTPCWGPVQEEAWHLAYRMIAERMVAGAAEASGPPYRFAEVVRHERRTADVAVLTCAPFPDPIQYQPGQYVHVETNHEPRQWRRYSIANAPRADGTLEFHVRAIGAGAVSPALVWKVRPGDILRLGEPAGSMRLPPPGRDLVCLSGGTGLAPIRALVESAPTSTWTRWVHLYYGVRTIEDLYDLPALAQLAADRPWLRLIPLVSDEPDYPGERGTPCDVLARDGPWDDHDFVLSGPPPMLRAVLRMLSLRRVPASRIQHDPY